MPGILDTVAAEHGIDPDMLSRIARIESSGNPNARTGSYKGLFQLSDQEFNKYGGGNIYSAADNARAAGAKIAAETAQLRQTLGRDPTATEIYMVHQQGPAGFAAHSADPDAPAWQNMASTGEGRQKGAGWARQAIWGNIPDQFKQQFGSVDNVTSRAFMDMWRQKVEGSGAPLQIADGPASGSPGGLPTQAGESPQFNAAALGAQSSPAGVPLFAQAQQQQQPNNAMTALGNYGMQMMQAPNPTQLAPLAPMQLRQPQVDYSGLQALLRGQKGFS